MTHGDDPYVYCGTEAAAKTAGAGLDVTARAAGPIPEAYALEANYPNPFNPSTTITYALPAETHVTLAVYTVTGQLVRTLVSGQQAAGTHRVTWDARDAGGHRVASGLYLYRLDAGSFQQTRSMVLLK